LKYLIQKIKLTIKPINNPFPTTNLEDGLGCLKYQGKAKSLKEIEQGIIEATKWFDENMIAVDTNILVRYL